MGIRYAGMLPVADVSYLPPALRTAINNSRAAFIAADRGHVRQGNDTSFGTRANLFARWLDSCGLDQHTAAGIRSSSYLDIVGAYIRDVKLGYNCHQSLTLSDATVRNYMSSATAVLYILTGTPCDLKELIATCSKPAPTLPYIRELITQRRTWKQPKPQKEVFTLPMYGALKKTLHQKAKVMEAIKVFCSKEYAVYDWTRLGVFTGSRIGEYGQSKVPKGQRWATIPQTADAGVWAGMPLAFIALDFTFYDENMIQLPHSYAHCPKRSSRIHEVHIRFRFDKSVTNFSIRKYRRQPSAPFDAIGPVINIFRRAFILGIPPTEPLGQFGTPRSPSQFTTHVLRDSHVSAVMRQACRDAYPNPLHYCRIHINRIVAHSNRVTAAVCLKMGGATDEEIAFRLRWHITSVPTYLRECTSSIDTLMQQAVFGAMRNT